MHLQVAPGGKGMMDIPEMNRQRIIIYQSQGRAEGRVFPDAKISTQFNPKFVAQETSCVAAGRSGRLPQEARFLHFDTFLPTSGRN
jgi:hypothetical protein